MTTAKKKSYIRWDDGNAPECETETERPFSVTFLIINVL